MENLIQQKYWNPYTVKTIKGNFYELSNIIIYNENGILFETNCGWFDRGNNNFGSCFVGDIVGIKRNINFSKKENFLTKDNLCTYDTRYILYIYYKNVNYIAKGLTLDNYWLNINATIFDNYHIENTIGEREHFVKKLQYSKELSENLEAIDNYNFNYHFEETLKRFKKLEKIGKQIEKAKEQAKEFTVEDWQMLLFNYETEEKRNECIKKVNNNLSLMKGE